MWKRTQPCWAASSGGPKPSLNCSNVPGFSRRTVWAQSMRVPPAGWSGGTGASLTRCEIAGHDFHGLGVFARGAELHDLGVRFDHGDVAGRRVVSVAGCVHLVAIGEAEGHLPALHVAPVRALAAIVR